MRIAVGTTDGLWVCEHLARSSTFVILDIEQGGVAGQSVREWGTDQCGSHKRFVDVLEGCAAVLCGGIGQGAVDALVAHGIEPMVLSQKQTVAEAVQHYLEGKLATTAARVCLCHEH